MHQYATQAHTQSVCVFRPAVWRPEKTETNPGPVAHLIETERDKYRHMRETDMDA
jgi:hypothetical protein